MSTPRDDFWVTVEAIVNAALHLPLSERARVLDDRCAGDPRLRDEIESLLASHDDAGAFMRNEALEDAGLSDPADAAGRVVGAFRLLDKIGEGGMGVVYRAERTGGDFTQRVAVKLLDAPVHGADGLRRFRSERQILGSLSHPHIVTLVDGGVTAEGQPYLVMEHVAGMPITWYCTERALGLDDRLRLFQQVCGAVQDAHQHGVVHRDLKPGNILVTADGIPKILDFGVAKLLDASGAVADATATGLLRPFTPNYASPEQVRGLPATTACDIYALGVLLHELLTGVRCYDTTGRTLDEILRVVVDDEPPRPSAASVAQGSRVPYELRRLRGDLDAIVLKAMAKEPARRYASARELSDDIARHLAGTPVVARELSLGYTAAKLARRHRAAVAAAAFSLVALLVALGVSLRQTQIAVTERNRARVETARAQQVSEFLRELFSSAYPRNRVPGAKLTAQDLVDNGVSQIDKVSAQPDVQASMLALLGSVYAELSLYEKAGPLLERSLALRERLYGSEHPDVAESLYALGRMLRLQSEHESALPVLERAIRIRERLEPPDDARLAETLSEMAAACTYLGRYQEARQHIERAVAIESRTGGPQLSRWLTTLSNLEMSTGDLDDAQEHLERALDVGVRTEGRAGFLVSVTVLNLGLVHRMQEDFERARLRLEEALEIAQELYGPEHQATIYNLGELGELYFTMGDHDRARAFLDRSIAVGERVLGRDHVGLAAPLSYYGRMLVAEQQPNKALPLFERALRLRERALPRDAADSLLDIARVKMRLEGAAAAEPLLRRALAVQRESLVARHRAMVPTLTALGEALSAQRRRTEAEAVLTDAVALARAKLPPGHSQRRRAELALQHIQD